MARLRPTAQIQLLAIGQQREVADIAQKLLGLSLLIVDRRALQPGMLAGTRRIEEIEPLAIRCEGSGIGFMPLIADAKASRAGR
jgi:hypothetical protein